MKVINIKGNRNVYTCNVYLILGEWRRIEDVNTLIDVGNDPSIIDVIQNIPTGVGKKKVERVILTHGHSDHMGILPLIREAFDPVVYAFSPYLKEVDRFLKNGDIVRCGDRDFEVLHTPEHSEDSICLYNEEEAMLFVGDTPIIVHSFGGTYEDVFMKAMKDLCSRNVQTIYFGHGDSIRLDAKSILLNSLKNMRNGAVEKNPSSLSMRTR